MSDDDMFVFVGVYSSPEDADLDYEAVRDLHASGVIGSYDAAIVAKDDGGKVHLRKHEKPTQHGAWSGLAIGAVIGAVFPPSVLAGGAVGAAAGGLVGHFARGISRGDMKDLGAMLDEGDAALVVLGPDRLDEVLADDLRRATRTYEKQVDADVRTLREELDTAIDESSNPAGV